MPYTVELSAEAEAIFDALPVDLAICINEHLHEELAVAPLARGRPSHFPYLPRGWIYDFWCEPQGAPVYVVVFFDVDLNNHVVQVFDFTVRSFTRPDSPDDL